MTRLHGVEKWLHRKAGSAWLEGSQSPPVMQTSALWMRLEDTLLTSTSHPSSPSSPWHLCLPRTRASSWSWKRMRVDCQRLRLVPWDVQCAGFRLVRCRGCQMCTWGTEMCWDEGHSLAAELMLFMCLSEWTKIMPYVHHVADICWIHQACRDGRHSPLLNSLAAHRIVLLQFFLDPSSPPLLSSWSLQWLCHLGKGLLQVLSTYCSVHSCCWFHFGPTEPHTRHPDSCPIMGLSFVK